ncbi:MAG: N-(5'-phosphoribosyl)anthranilate isomerase [Thermoanaerobaculales bacterium]
MSAMASGPSALARSRAAVTVKICGITREADARHAVEAGADYLGFVFYPVSRRCLDEAAFKWIREISGAKKVGVFRDQDSDFIRRVRDAARLDLIQLHGEEPPQLCEALGGRAAVIKAISPSSTPDWRRVAVYAEVARVLFDTASATGGGTGHTFDWHWLDDRPADLEFWLAGGLTAENVCAAVRGLRPAGVDVASGVELAVGEKDPAKIRTFIAAVRSAERE